MQNQKYQPRDFSNLYSFQVISIQFKRLAQSNFGSNADKLLFSSPIDPCYSDSVIIQPVMLDIGVVLPSRSELAKQRFTEHWDRQIQKSPDLLGLQDILSNEWVIEQAALQQLDPEEAELQLQPFHWFGLAYHCSHKR